MIKDYRVKITIRNERILKLIEDSGFVSVRSFCHSHKIAYQQLTELIAGKVKPFTENGLMVTACRQMLEVLNVTLEDCFTSRQIQGFNKRSFEIKVKEQELKKIINPTKNQEQKLMEQQAKNRIRYAIEMGLEPREAAMLKMKFGFDYGVEHSGEEIAKKLPEYSYKTIASIIDEGIQKGFYVPLEPYENSVGKKIIDKKVKNIRPSLDLITSFYNWNIDRIARISDILKKYK